MTVTPLARAAGRIAGLSIGQMLWSRRTLFMVMVTGVPIAIGGWARVLDTVGRFSVDVDNVRVAGPVLFGLMIWAFYIRFIVPVLGVFYGTALIADEVDDRTITYLFTRPIPRAAVLLGKYAAYLVCTTMVVLPSVVVVYLLVAPIQGGLAGSFVALLVDLGILWAGLAVYGALFALVGSLVKRPLLVGLGFVLGWEPTVLLVPGYLRQFTLAHYLQGLVPHTMPQGDTLEFLRALFRTTPTVGMSLTVLATVTVVSLALAMWTISHREYVVES